MAENQCPTCKHENKAENLFCTQCGQKLFDDQFHGPRLLVLTSKKKSIVFQIQPGRSTIGRDIGNAVVINDEQISKFHAAMVYENNVVYIEDLESKNGVFVGGKRIEGRTICPNGCLIKLGSTILKFDNNDPGTRTDL